MNISSFIDFHLKPPAQKVKSYIQDTNDLLKKIANLPPLSNNLTLYKVDLVGIYPNIPHKDRLITIRRALNTRNDKRILRGSLITLEEYILKNNIFQHDKLVF